MPATETQVDRALARLGNYRVRRAQIVANAGAPDGISGALLLALGLRETNGINEQGGAKWDATKNRWVAQDDPTKMDVGIFQISRIHHGPALAKMLGVRDGTWGPVITGSTPNDNGYVPRFEESLQFTLREMHESMGYASSKGVPDEELARFAVAAHNAGAGGALSGYRDGDVDKYTAMGDYSAWVLETRTIVNKWLAAHPNWRVSA